MGGTDNYYSPFNRSANFTHDGNFGMIEQFPESIYDVLLLAIEEHPFGSGFQLIRSGNFHLVSAFAQDFGQPLHFRAIIGGFLADRHQDRGIVRIGTQRSEAFHKRFRYVVRIFTKVKLFQKSSKPNASGNRVQFREGKTISSDNQVRAQDNRGSPLHGFDGAMLDKPFGFSCIQVFRYPWRREVAITQDSRTGSRFQVKTFECLVKSQAGLTDRMQFLHRIIGQGPRFRGKPPTLLGKERSFQCRSKNGQTER